MKTKLFLITILVSLSVSVFAKEVIYEFSGTYGELNEATENTLFCHVLYVDGGQNIVKHLNQALEVIKKYKLKFNMKKGDTYYFKFVNVEKTWPCVLTVKVYIDGKLIKKAEGSSTLIVQGKVK